MIWSDWIRRSPRWGTKRLTPKPGWRYNRISVWRDRREIPCAYDNWTAGTFLMGLLAYFPCHINILPPSPRKNCIYPRSREYFLPTLILICYNWWRTRARRTWIWQVQRILEHTSHFLSASSVLGSCHCRIESLLQFTVHFPSFTLLFWSIQPVSNFGTLCYLYFWTVIITR